MLQELSRKLFDFNELDELNLPFSTVIQLYLLRRYSTVLFKYSLPWIFYQRTLFAVDAQDGRGGYTVNLLSTDLFFLLRFEPSEQFLFSTDGG